MSEAEHLSEALEGFLIQPDNGWFTPVTVAIEGLTAEQAAKIPAPRFNSIWAVVNHLRFWQEFILLRLRGQEVDRRALGDENGWPPIPEPLEQETWQAACQKMLVINRELAGEIASLNDEQLNDPYAPGRAKRWQIIQGAIAHNSYHACEIISIRHMIGLWLERT